MKSKSVLVCCSNRSEYGLLRPLIVRMGDPTRFRSIASVVLLLFSDAVDSCASDAKRDLPTGSAQIETMEFSRLHDRESVSAHFARLIAIFSGGRLSKYDGILLAGDRYETFAVATSAFLEHVPVFHFFGGDISMGGHFDDHLRHAISHLASIHFPVNETAKSNLLAMRQQSSRIFHVGSPVVDEIAEVIRNNSIEYSWNIILSFNPMTLGPPHAVTNCLEATLAALDELSLSENVSCLATRPNNEPGSQEINGLLDRYSASGWLEVVGSLGSPAYLYAIRSASLVVGNSSAQLLEAPVLGTRSLMIGDRQKGRHTPASVDWLPGEPGKNQIREHIRLCLGKGRPHPCADYGIEGVSDSVLAILDDLISLPRSALSSKSAALTHEICTV